MILDVDGKKIEEPDNAAVAREFESIDKRTGFRGALSCVTLRGDKLNSLTAGGHPVEGWGALIHEEGGISYGANVPNPLKQEKMIQIFQSYLRGEDSWKKEFEWEIMAGKFPIKRIIVGLAIFLALLFLSRSCVK